MLTSVTFIPDMALVTIVGANKQGIISYTGTETFANESKYANLLKG